MDNGAEPIAPGTALGTGRSDPEFVDYAVMEMLGLTDHTTRLPRELFGQGAAAALWPSVGLRVRQGRALGREAAASRALGRTQPLSR
ncbi:hypothetical protein AB0D34_11560 [Streptomyces sp. NPDC048420]|uniref:hypothetical protein n=1 Tax=Streptomyces sp. NPDC048420 TaxID=3155755 RepID=UPI00341460BD